MSGAEVIRAEAHQAHADWEAAERAIAAVGTNLDQAILRGEDVATVTRLRQEHQAAIDNAAVLRSRAGIARDSAESATREQAAHELAGLPPRGTEFLSREVLESFARLIVAADVFDRALRARALERFEIERHRLRLEAVVAGGEPGEPTPYEAEAVWARNDLGVVFADLCRILRVDSRRWTWVFPADGPRRIPEMTVRKLLDPIMSPSR